MKERYRIIIHAFSEDNKSLHIHSIETQDTKIGAEQRIHDLASCLLKTFTTSFDILKYNRITGPYGDNHLTFIGSLTKHEFSLEYHEVFPYVNDEYFYRGFHIQKRHNGSWLYNTKYSTRFIEKPFDEVLHYIDELLAIATNQSGVIEYQYPRSIKV